MMPCPNTSRPLGRGGNEQFLGRGARPGCTCVDRAGPPWRAMHTDINSGSVRRLSQRPVKAPPVLLLLHSRWRDAQYRMRRFTVYDAGIVPVVRPVVGRLGSGSVLLQAVRSLVWRVKGGRQCHVAKEGKRRRELADDGTTSRSRSAAGRLSTRSLLQYPPNAHAEKLFTVRWCAPKVVSLANCILLPWQYSVQNET